MARPAPGGTRAVNTGDAPRPSGLGDVLGFLALSHGWTWAFWAIAGVLAALMGATVWDFPAIAFFLVGGTGVFLGGVVMSSATYGRAGLKHLGRRIVDPRLLAPRWWAVVLLLFPAMTLAAGGIAVALGLSPTPFDLDGGLTGVADPLGLLVTAGFILVIGPLPEEIGWRGYLLDRLQLRLSALGASLLIAFVWWTWHLPLLALPGYYQAFGGAPSSPLVFLSGIVPTAILLTWIYNNTGRSVLAVIVAHLMDNLAGELLGFSNDAWLVRVLVMAAVAALVVWWWGPRTLRRDAIATVP